MTKCFQLQIIFHDALNWSTWYSCFTWNFLRRLTSAWLTFLTANKFINDGNVVWRTKDRCRPVSLFLSALPVSSILLIRSFKVLRFHCLEGNYFIIVSAPHPFSTRNARINALSSLVNGCVFIFTSTMSAMTSHRILITAEYLNAHFFTVCLFVYALQVLFYENFCKLSEKVE